MITIVNASARLSALAATTTAIATAIGPVRTRYLRPSTTKYRSEEAYSDRPIDSGNRIKPRRYAEGQCDRQPHHRCGDAAKDVSTEGLKAVVEVHQRSIISRSIHHAERNQRTLQSQFGTNFILVHRQSFDVNTELDETERMGYHSSMPVRWTGSILPKVKSHRMSRNVPQIRKLGP